MEGMSSFSMFLFALATFWPYVLFMIFVGIASCLLSCTHRRTGSQTSSSDEKRQSVP